MDLMIEAKDKEQAVFELMRTFKLPGFDRFNDVIPHEREDEPRPPPKAPKAAKKKQKKKSAAGGVKAEDGNGGGLAQKRKRAPDEDPIDLDEVGAGAEDVDDVDDTPPEGKIVSDEEFGMGGPLNRVYWPPGMEDWLKPKKRDVKNGSAVVLDEEEDSC